MSNFVSEFSPTLEEERRKQFTDYRAPNLDPTAEVYRKNNTFSKLAKLSESRDNSPNSHHGIQPRIPKDSQPVKPIAEERTPSVDKSKQLKVLNLDTDQIFD